jgi:NTP pyrophosphatase (non-canonical NTP hydrolase)
MPDESGTEPLTIRRAQHEVDTTILAQGGYWPPLANLARLFEECGELARALNQVYGRKLVKSGEMAVTAQEELGDILYVLLALANDLQIDAEAALAQALAKAHRRSLQAERGSE